MDDMTALDDEARDAMKLLADARNAEREALARRDAAIRRMHDDERRTPPAIHRTFVALYEEAGLEPKGASLSNIRSVINRGMSAEQRKMADRIAELEAKLAARGDG